MNVCRCGHTVAAHVHYRRGTDCGFVGCACQRLRRRLWPQRREEPGRLTVHGEPGSSDHCPSCTARTAGPARAGQENRDA